MRERGDEDGRGIIAVAERSGIEPWRDQFYNEHSDTLVLDPFATAITLLPDWDFSPARGYDPAAAEPDLVCSKIDDAGAMPKCVFTDEHFHWHDDRPPRNPWSKTVIYETHVRGFTIHPGAGVEHAGTYRGLMEKIPYLKDLGVTAVELMPIYEFNESRVPAEDPQTGELLRNYWGYDPVAFFAPKASYSSAGGLGQQKLEFKEMVLALHQGGIEVILDVVFNHTTEGNELGPTLCFRGMDNAIFYTLAPDPRCYMNYAGTGNDQCQPSRGAGSYPGSVALLGGGDACGWVSL
jgi:glycogen operon protein